MAKSLTFLRTILLLLVFLIIKPLNATPSYNVKKFGAKSDGKTDSTKPFTVAWSMACKSRTPAMVYVPRGTFMVRNVVFEGPCRNKITFRIDGTVVAPKYYWELGNSGSWIMFSKVSRVAVVGGTIDARGKGYWKCKRSGGHCPPGAKSLSFSWCQNVLVSGLTSLNSQMKHITIHHSNNVKIQNIRIRAPSGSPNTDGIYMEASTGVTISRSAVLTGDDCISMGEGSKNIWIDRIMCGPGHGISIGSLGNSVKEDGVQNVTVSRSVFTKTQNGVRIKSWARRSNGYVRNIVFRDLIMINVFNPLIIDQNYCPQGKGCPHQSGGVKINGVTYSNIKGTSASKVGMKLDCGSGNECTGIILRNVRLTYRRSPAASYCKNAHGRSSGTILPNNCL